MAWEIVRVEAYAATKAAEEPRAFELGGERVEVEEVIDRWLGSTEDPTDSSQDYFRVRTADGAVRMLRYNRIFHAWAIRHETA